MVHLSESALLARSFAAQLGALEHALTEGAVGGPDEAFGSWAAAVADSPYPAVSATSLSSIPQARWAEAPVLSAVGFRVATAAVDEADAAERWVPGFRRLMARDPAPADRNSFLFRPVEMLGLVAGAKALALHDEEPMRWLRETFESHRHRITTSTVWQKALCELVARDLGLRPSAECVSGAASMLDAAVLLWARLAADEVGRALSSSDEESLRRALLASAATEDAGGLRGAEAAVTWIALRHAVVAAVGAFANRPSQPAEFVADICRNFPYFVAEMAKRYGGREPFGRIDDEYDVQDLLRAMLRLHFADVRVEEWTPSYGGVHSRTDFLLKAERVVVETKMTRKGLAQRDVVQELTVDKAQYRAHPACGTLVCFVYDPDARLANPAAVERDLSDSEPNLRTIVVVSPKLAAVGR